MKTTVQKLFDDYNKKLQLELVKKQLEIKLITTKEFNNYMTVNDKVARSSEKKKAFEI
jgi:hypothetical protein